MYLFNRMPTLVLKNKSIFECLFHRTPDYDFLYIFECLCFLYLCLLFSMFDFLVLKNKSPSYVFLGNSSSYLDYRFLDLTSQRIYVTCHVRFHEHLFSFDKFEQIVYPSTPLHIIFLLPTCLICLILHFFTLLRLQPLYHFFHLKKKPLALPLCYHILLYQMIIIQVQILPL